MLAGLSCSCSLVSVPINHVRTAALPYSAQQPQQSHTTAQSFTLKAHSNRSSATFLNLSLLTMVCPVYPFPRHLHQPNASCSTPVIRSSQKGHASGAMDCP